MTYAESPDETQHDNHRICNGAQGSIGDFCAPPLRTSHPDPSHILHLTKKSRLASARCLGAFAVTPDPSRGNFFNAQEECRQRIQLNGCDSSPAKFIPFTQITQSECLQESFNLDRVGYIVDITLRVMQRDVDGNSCND